MGCEAARKESGVVMDNNTILLTVLFAHFVIVLSIAVYFAISGARK